MSKWDTINVKIYNIERADVYLAKGKGYRWLNHLDQMVQEGATFNTVDGWSFYVVGVSNSMLQGTFSMKIWIEKGYPTGPVDRPKANVFGDDYVQEEVKVREEEKKEEKEEEDKPAKDDSKEAKFYLEYTVKIEMSFVDFFNNGGSQNFRDTLGGSMGISSDRIIITSIV
jgi:hypothetical protein